MCIVSVIAFILQFETYQSYAIWQRQTILDGQWWRLITGHFTHTNTYHALVNVATFWIMSFIFKPRPNELVILMSVLAVCIGLLNLLTPVQEYAGLSGILHGVFAYYALRETLSGRKSSGLLVLGILAKVAWEQVYGASESTAELIQASVAVDAHFFGAVLGLSYAGLVWVIRNVKND